jgi:hypothetical protein
MATAGQEGTGPARDSGIWNDVLLRVYQLIRITNMHVYIVYTWQDAKIYSGPGLSCTQDELPVELARKVGIHHRDIVRLALVPSRDVADDMVREWTKGDRVMKTEEQRILELEDQGLTHGDAVGVVMAEDLKAERDDCTNQ